MRPHLPCSFSSSTATQIINGRATSTLELQFPVAGASGREALASVRQAKRGASARPAITIDVRPLVHQPMICKDNQ